MLFRSGDGVLVYFGYPEAHEDDAERAVRAGLALIAAVAALKAQFRCKLALVLPPGWSLWAICSAPARRRSEALSARRRTWAARLQALAEPNGVVIAESTRKLLGNLFELDELGVRELKGITGSVRAWAGIGGAKQCVTRGDY